MVTVIGIDVSLTSTGVARLDWTPWHSVYDPDVDAVHLIEGDHHWSPMVHSVASKGSRDAGLSERWDRVRDMAKRVNGLIPRRTRLAVIEAPSYGSQGGSSWDRAFLWWSIVDCLLVHEIPVVQVAPTTRALWATGKGGSDKAAVSAAIARIWPAAELWNSDEVDALALASIGIQILGDAVPFDITAYRTRALAKVKVPDYLETAA